MNQQPRKHWCWLSLQISKRVCFWLKPSSSPRLTSRKKKEGNQTVAMVESERTKHTCLRLVLSGTDPIFVKGTWHPSRFDISITDGSSSWLCNGTNPHDSNLFFFFFLFSSYELIFLFFSVWSELKRRRRRWRSGRRSGTSRCRSISSSPSST